MAETSYQVLARKWRPQSFAELKGLEHITRTLQNAIRRDRVGHAFIFTGSRGVGKTSAARILAKALNCAEGPAPEPCNRCDNCRAITAGTAPDVIEIDGASNRGVGEIRLLRDGVTYLPQSSPYKIYIIDEVHMLTTEAFNALLKTLEEPPPHVKFIMATTDVHKLPMTILSRCQRFDFGRLTGATIAAALEEIGSREGLVFGPGTVDLLAREARGSMRDALSLLDQVSAYAGSEITVTDLRAALGLIEARHCLELLAAIVEGDLATAVGQIGELEQAGVDLKDFAKEFLFFLRDALFLKLSGRLEKQLGIGPDEAAALKPLVASRQRPYWQQLFALWQERYSGLYVAQIPRLALEMAVVELGMARDLKPLDELLERLDRGLSAGVTATVTATATTAVPGKTGSRPVEKVSAPRSKTAVKPVVKPSAKTAASPQGAAPVGPEPENLPPAAPPEARPASADDPPPWATASRPSAPLVRDRGAEAQARDAGESRRKVAAESRNSGGRVAEAGAGANAGTADQTFQKKPEKKIVQPEPPAVGEGDGGELTAQRWEAFLAYLGRHDGRLGAMLKGSRLIGLEAGGIARIEAAPYVLASLEHESSKTAIAKQLATFLGRPEPLEPCFVAANGNRKSADSGGGAAAAGPGPGGRGRLPDKEEIFKDEAVRFLSDRFGGRVTEIRPRR